MPIIDGLGERMREARLSKGLSLEELAKTTDSNRRSLYSYEKGLVDPKVGDLKLIAEALDVSLCGLITGGQRAKTAKSAKKVALLVRHLRSITRDEWNEILSKLLK